MAFACVALLATLALAADASPISMLARRLNDDEPPPECMAACPCVNEMIKEMPQNESADGHEGHDHDGDGEVHESDQGMQMMMIMCKYKAAFQCMQEHPDECGHEDDMKEMTDRVSCLCDACPHFLSAQMDLMVIMATAMANAFAGLADGAPAGGQPSDNGMEETMCRFKASMECVDATPECAATAAEMAADQQPPPARKLSGMEAMMDGLTCDETEGTTEQAHEVEQATCSDSTTSAGAVVSRAFGGRSPSPLVFAPLLALIATLTK